MSMLMAADDHQRQHSGNITHHRGTTRAGLTCVNARQVPSRALATVLAKVAETVLREEHSGSDAGIGTDQTPLACAGLAVRAFGIAASATPCPDPLIVSHVSEKDRAEHRETTHEGLIVNLEADRLTRSELVAERNGPIGVSIGSLANSGPHS